MSARASIIPVFVSHLGCPHACVFCNQRRISGAQKPATAEDVKNSIEQAAAFLPRGGKRQLAFYGGSFTAIPAAAQEELLGAAAEALEAGHRVTIDFDAGVIEDVTVGARFRTEPFPPFMQALIAAGGLAAYLRQDGPDGRKTEEDVP